MSALFETPKAPALPMQAPAPPQIDTARANAAQELDSLRKRRGYAATVLSKQPPGDLAAKAATTPAPATKALLGL